MKSRQVPLIVVLLLVSTAAGVLWRRNAIELAEMKRQAEAESAAKSAPPAAGRHAMIEENNKSRPMTGRDLRDIVEKTVIELKARPNDPQLHVQLAVALSLVKRLDEAADELEKAVKLAPRDTQVVGTAGMFYLRLGDAQAALPHLKRAHRIAPQDFDGILNLAKAHWVRGKVDTTLSLLDKASRMAANSAKLQEQLAGYCTELPLRPNAVRAWRKVLELQPNSGLALQQLSFYELEAGNFETALKFLDRALKAAPDKGSLYSLLGTVYVSKEPTPENLQKAGTNLNKAIELGQSEDSATRYYLGRMHLRLGNLPEAAEQLEAAVRINHNYREAHYDLAQVYAAQKRGDEARAERQKFNEIYQAQNKLNLVLRRSQTSPSNANLHYELAKLQLKSNNPVAALPHLQRALELNPKLTEVRRLIAKVHSAMGRPRRAEQLMEGK